MKRLSLVCLFLLLSGCIIPTNLNYPGLVDVALGSPESNTTWFVGEQVQLEGYANLPTGGPTVDRFTFYSDARQIAEFATDSSATRTFPYAAGHWTPPAAGEYQIQVWARLSNGRLAVSDPARICVLNIAIPEVSSIYPDVPV